MTAAPGRPPASPSRGPVEATDVRFPRGLTVLNASIDDAILVTELSAACELADDGEVQITVEDTLSEWSRPTFDASSDVRLVFDRERLVGYAEVFGARKAWGYVHPEHRGRGIGAALVDWTERYARRGGGRLVGQSISENETAARDLFLSRGYGPLWNSWILEKELARDEAPPVLSGGLRLRNFEAGRDDLRVYQVVEDAFNEWPDRDPTPFEDWRAMTLGRSDFDPELLFVMEDEKDIVGVAYCIEDRGTWWVQQLAVRASHRGRGLGRALLQQAFHRAGQRGLHRVGLSTDSRTGALGLYERVGMHVMRTYTHYAKPL